MSHEEYEELPPWEEMADNLDRDDFDDEEPLPELPPLEPVEPLPLVNAGTLVMRDYQIEAVQGIYDQLRDHRSTLAVLATGLGKTVIAAEVALLWPEQHGRVLFLAHRKELIEQAAKSIGLHIDEACGIEMGQQSEARQGRSLHGLGKVLVGSVQTLCRLNRLKPYKPDDFGLIITDESHHATASSYKTIFGWFQQNPQCRFLGITATPDRADEQKLGEVFETVAHKMDILDGIEQGWLVPIEQRYVVIEGLDFAACRTTAGDLNDRDLERAMAGANADEIGDDEAELTEDQVEARKKQERMLHAVADPTIREANGRPGIVFCVTIDHSEKMAAIFRRYGVTAESVTQNTTPDMRAEHIAAFKRGTLQFLIGVGVFTEGFDAPNAAVIAVARPTKSRALYCLDEQTEALTPKGWIRGSALREGDVVAAFDCRTNAVRWEPVLAHVSRDLYPDEAMLAARGPSIDIRMTDSHRMVYRIKEGRAAIRSEWRIKKAGELLPIDSFELPVCGVQSGPGLPLTDYEIGFIGLVLTDGNYNPHNGQISLYQSEGSPFFEHFEEILRGCGFKFGKTTCDIATNKGRRKSTAVRWTISRGAPRGRDKHLSGWGRLAEYIPKVTGSWSIWENCTPDQWTVMLVAMHIGDGVKAIGRSWTPRSYHICMKRREWAEAIQSISVRRGWRCSLAVQKNGPGQTINFLHLKHTDFITVGGARAKGRTVLAPTPFSRDELVWCISVPSGAFITRRNGKVCVVGNTQMIGRATRPEPTAVNGVHDVEERIARIAASNKPSATVLDFVGNSGKHKLISTADILGDAFPEDLRAEVVEAMRRLGTKGDVRKEMADLQARKELMKRLAKEEEEKKREADRLRYEETLKRIQEERRLRNLKAEAQYRTREVDPFGHKATHQPGQSQFRGGASEAQIALLEKLGVKHDTALSYSKGQAGAVITDLKSRVGGKYRITFGKHKGKSLAEAGSGFVWWIENQMEDGDLKNTLQRHIDLMRLEQRGINQGDGV